MDLQDSVVYGPIQSRRLGRSLGINPLPLCDKFCNFDCVYCQYGHSRPQAHKLPSDACTLLNEVHKAFHDHRKIGTVIDCITVAGNGEPTLHFEFSRFIDGLLALRDEFYPGVKTGILSNASRVHIPEIRDALMKLDERYMKLDAGTEALLKKISRPQGNFMYERMIEGLRELKDVVIQSLFVHGSFDNTGSAEVAAWVKRLSEIKPREIHVYTLDRKPADSSVQKVSVDELRQIAAFCESETGIKACVFD